MPSTRKKKIATLVNFKLFDEVRKVSEETGESMSQTAKMLIILGLKVYNSTQKTTDEPNILIDSL